MHRIIIWPVVSTKIRTRCNNMARPVLRTLAHSMEIGTHSPLPCSFLNVDDLCGKERSGEYSISSHVFFDERPCSDPDLANQFREKAHIFWGGCSRRTLKCTYWRLRISWEFYRRSFLANELVQKSFEGWGWCDALKAVQPHNEADEKKCSFYRKHPSRAQTLRSFRAERNLRGPLALLAQLAQLGFCASWLKICASLRKSAQVHTMGTMDYQFIYC